MSSGAIFVCHDCRLARDSEGVYPSLLAHKGVFEIPLLRLVEADYVCRFDDVAEWIEVHRGHDAGMHSDAHGTFGASDYDFEKRDFIYEQ